MSIGVASVQQKEFITASAVYYREQRFAAESAVVVVVVVGQASWPNVWHQRVWNCIWVLEQCLISATLEQQWLNSGHKLATVTVCRNSTIITSEYTCICVHIILQCPLQISNISITKDDEELLSTKYNSAAQMFQMSIKVECCNKDVEQFFSSFSRSRKEF